jgi:hypothetical protein
VCNGFSEFDMGAFASFGEASLSTWSKCNYVCRRLVGLWVSRNSHIDLLEEPYATTIVLPWCSSEFEAG